MFAKKICDEKNGETFETLANWRISQGINFHEWAEFKYFEGTVFRKLEILELWTSISPNKNLFVSAFAVFTTPRLVKDMI